jgi:hypothetical protein
MRLACKGTTNTATAPPLSSSSLADTVGTSLADTVGTSPGDAATCSATCLQPIAVETAAAVANHILHAACQLITLHVLRSTCLSTRLQL